VPARKRPSRSPFPPVIALDTSLLVAALNSLDPKHSQARPVYQRLAQAGTTVAICRPLMWMELRAAFRKTANVRSPAELRTIVRDAEARLGTQLSLFGQPNVGRTHREKREYFVPAAERLTERFLSPLRLVPVRLTNSLLTEASPHVVQWNLNSHDALILAVAARVAGPLNLSRLALATTDKDFDRVDDLDVWGRI
jgi:predicted nucleic acid-binding protein